MFKFLAFLVVARVACVHSAPKKEYIPPLRKGETYFPPEEGYDEFAYQIIQSVVTNNLGVKDLKVADIQLISDQDFSRVIISRVRFFGSDGKPYLLKYISFNPRKPTNDYRGAVLTTFFEGTELTVAPKAAPDVLR